MVEYVRLGDVCDVSAGQGAPQGEDKYCNDGGTPFIKAGSLEYLINGGSLDLVQGVTDDVAKTHKLKLYPKGTVVFAKSGMSCFKNYVYELKRGAYVVSHLACLIPKNITSGYLKYCITANPPSNSVSGMSYPSLSLKDIASLQIPLPPLTIQRKIVHTLDIASDLIAKRKKQIALLDDLAKSLFVEMFGDLAYNQHEWLELPLYEIGVCDDSIKCGPFGTQLNKDEYQSTGIPLWGIPEINSSFKINPSTYLTHEKAKALDAYSVIPNDIVMSRKGNVGKCALYPPNFSKGIIHSDVLRIRPNPDKINSCFLMYQLHNSRYIISQISDVSNGAIMQGINVTKLKKINIHIPPLALQQEFASRISQIEAERHRLEVGLHKMEENYKALMQEYFG